uniref:Uncharacterized protein n=1 Tax=Arundo donax TaxID=35708 RepID=A0A0A9FRH2_ARUDO
MEEARYGIGIILANNLKECSCQYLFRQTTSDLNEQNIKLTGTDSPIQPKKPT